jgi:hypothetical protein
MVDDFGQGLVECRLQAVTVSAAMITDHCLCWPGRMSVLPGLRPGMYLPVSRYGSKVSPACYLHRPYN